MVNTCCELLQSSLLVTLLIQLPVLIYVLDPKLRLVSALVVPWYRWPSDFSKTMDTDECLM